MSLGGRKHAGCKPTPTTHSVPVGLVLRLRGFLRPCSYLVRISIITCTVRSQLQERASSYSSSWLHPVKKGARNAGGSPSPDTGHSKVNNIGWLYFTDNSNGYWVCGNDCTMFDIVLQSSRNSICSLIDRRPSSVEVRLLFIP